MDKDNSEKRQIAHYRIISRIGTGGIGEVYLAEDTRLGRNVALKILLGQYAEDSDTRRRFGQEARSASGLNHPNIITIYEIGQWEEQDYIAMEFVPGQSVRDLILEKRLKLNDALNIAIQVASALGAAHSVGIVHRDIKPENIICRPDGLIKVLDFGLAKQVAPVLETGEVDSEASTYGAMGTLPGMVMGTVPYMSPEQARGKPVDARTDIWSLGAVLYEMISGRTPFRGETKSDLLASILTREPEPLLISTPAASRELEHIIRKALVKDRNERYQSVKDLYLDLKILQGELNSGAFETELLTHTTSEEAAVHTQNHITSSNQALATGNRWMWPVILAILGIGALAIWYVRDRGTTADTNYLSSLVSTQVTSWKNSLGEIDSGPPRFSPDGKLIAYVSTKDGRSAVWIKQIAGGEPFTRKEDDAVDSSPIWSPDSERIAYFSNRGGRRGIWTAPALGGTPTLLGEFASRGQLIHWSKDGSTIYFDRNHRNLFSLDVATGKVTQLTNFDEAGLPERAFSVSPDENRIVYTNQTNGQSDLWVAGLRGENPVRLTNDPYRDGTPVWHPDGKRVIYNSDRNGIRQIYLAFTDGREPVQLTLADSDLFVADVSSDGRQILYATSKDDSDLWGINIESGKEFQITSDIGAEFWPDVAPDGSAVVYQGARRTSLGSKLLNCQIFTQRLGGNTHPSQIVPDGYNPQWSPDGKQIAFLRSDAGNSSLWVSSAAGGDARPLTKGGLLFGGFSPLPYNRVQVRDYDWSPDGRALVYSADRDGAVNIWQADSAGAGETRLTNNSEKGLLFFNPIFSPDGSAVAWLAFKLGPPAERYWAVWWLKDGKAEELYRTGFALRLVGWNAEGSGLIAESIPPDKEVLTTPVDISVVEVSRSGGTPRRVAEIRSAYLHNFALSRDRRTLAFASVGETGDTISVLPLGGGPPKRILAGNEPRVYFSNLVFGPDNKTLFYGQQANWQVISLLSNFK